MYLEMLRFATNAAWSSNRSSSLFGRPGKAIGSNRTAREIVGGRSRARWRRTRPDVLNDLPAAVWLAFVDDDVAAFGGDFRSARDVR